MKSDSVARNSSSSPRQKPRAPCENVEHEFSRRFLSLFISAYDSTHISDPLNFPPAKQSGSPTAPSRPKAFASFDAAGEPSKPKSLASRPAPFDGAVWDIRLRKATARRRADGKAAGATVTAQLDFFTALTAKPPPDLSPVFLPEPALRPETPRYLANARADLEAEGSRSKREKTAPLSLGDADAKWQARVGKQEQRRAARGAQMRAYRAKDEKAQKEFLQGLGGREQREKTIKQ
jgi:hypothetical protein